VRYRNIERARFSKQRNERALLLFKTYIYNFYKKKKIFDMLSGWAACVLISIIKLRLGFHKNHAGQGRLCFVA
jgi:hypothetical protein